MELLSIILFLPNSFTHVRTWCSSIVGLLFLKKSMKSHSVLIFQPDRLTAKLPSDGRIVCPSLRPFLITCVLTCVTDVNCLFYWRGKHESKRFIKILLVKNTCWTFLSYDGWKDATSFFKCVLNSDLMQLSASGKKVVNVQHGFGMEFHIL